MGSKSQTEFTEDWPGLAASARMSGGLAVLVRATKKKVFKSGHTSGDNELSMKMEKTSKKEKKTKEILIN